MKTLRQQQYERALAGECDPEDFVELYRTFLGVEEQAAFWRQAAGAERKEVERLRALLSLATPANELSDEVERLRVEKERTLREHRAIIEKLRAEADDLRRAQTVFRIAADGDKAEVERLRDELSRLRNRNGRLNKAVTWLAGALPDDVEFDWERGRAATLLGEDW